MRIEDLLQIAAQAAGVFAQRREVNLIRDLDLAERTAKFLRKECEEVLIWAEKKQARDELPDTMMIMLVQKKAMTAGRDALRRAINERGQERYAAMLKGTRAAREEKLAPVLKAIEGIKQEPTPTVRMPWEVEDPFALRSDAPTERKDDKSID